MRTTTPDSTCWVISACGESITSAASSTPAVDRPRVHQQLVGPQPAAVDLVAGRVLAQRGHERARHALALHPQGVDHVGLAQLVERVAHLAAERLDPARDQRRRPADRDLAAHAA